MAIALGIGRRAPDGSVVFVSPPAGEGAGSSETPHPSAQAASSSEPTSAGAGSASTAATPPATAGSEAAGGASGGMESGDLEALAVRLYPRISRQIRLELTRERDRLGALTDFRH